MTTTSQAAISISRLCADLAGQVIGPDDSEYERARLVFLPQFDRRPAAIVRPAGATEVAYVVSLAREQGLELAVRSGGHSSAGHGVSEAESCSTSLRCGFLSGAYRDRTGDLRLAKPALSQLS